MRYGRIVFSKQTVPGQGKFFDLPIYKLIKAFECLPSDAKVVNIYESPNFVDAVEIMVESAFFKYTVNTALAPEITFIVDYADNVTADLSHVLDSAQGDPWALVPNTKIDLTPAISCTHEWIIYTGLGLTNPFDYCKNCGVKK